jgi:uncharacterized protein DUF4136
VSGRSATLQSNWCLEVDLYWLTRILGKARRIHLKSASIVVNSIGCTLVELEPEGNCDPRGILIMAGRRVTVSLLLCLSVLYAVGNAVGQDVKSTFDKSADFAKYKKYTWGSNYLLTQQPKDVQERINMAIVDSINRNLRAGGFVEDDTNPDFKITYEGGPHPKSDVGAQRYLYASDMMGYYWSGNVTGISSDVWVSSLAKLEIAVTDAATGSNLWQATASKKIHEPKKFANNLQENVDKIIQKTMKSFPPPPKK